MVPHQLATHCTQRLLRGGNLNHDVRAVAVFLDHLLKPPNLAFQSPEAAEVTGLVFRVD
jgi:hypothetical protein